MVAWRPIWLSLQNAPRPNHPVRPNRNCIFQISAVWIDKGNAIQHMRLQNPSLQQLRNHGQLNAVINAITSSKGASGLRIGRPSKRDRHQISQEIFTLGIKGALRYILP